MSGAIVSLERMYVEDEDARIKGLIPKILGPKYDIEKYLDKDITDKLCLVTSIGESDELAASDLTKVKREFLCYAAEKDPDPRIQEIAWEKLGYEEDSGKAEITD